ncbi:MAG TPA: hypothetical protein VMW10_06720, partial [Alphaproteobacteria bacterium]|nr:hypothetical protein [Alphaproteobacteria bacterium]
TTPAFQAGAVAEADELVFFGSDALNPNATRRCMMKIPALALAGIDADGCILTAYATGDTPSTEGVSMTLSFKPIT